MINVRSKKKEFNRIEIDVLFLFQEFTYTGKGNISYHEIDDWITINMFRFQPKAAEFCTCFLFELYGCPEGKEKFFYIKGMYNN